MHRIRDCGSRWLKEGEADMERLKGFFSAKNLPHLPMLMVATAAAKSLQSCPTLCDSIDGNPPGSLVPGILQARTLEWVAISFSNA